MLEERSSLLHLRRVSSRRSVEKKRSRRSWMGAKKEEVSFELPFRRRRSASSTSKNQKLTFSAENRYIGGLEVLSVSLPRKVSQKFFASGNCRVSRSAARRIALSLPALDCVDPPFPPKAEPNPSPTSHHSSTSFFSSPLVVSFRFHASRLVSAFLSLSPSLNSPNRSDPIPIPPP